MPLRRLLLWIMILGTLLSSTQLILISGLHRQWGISDQVFVLGDSVILTVSLARGGGWDKRMTPIPSEGADACWYRSHMNNILHSYRVILHVAALLSCDAVGLPGTRCRFKCLSCTQTLICFHVVFPRVVFP